MPETVLITGGAGFIGSHLARRLLAEGHRVRAFDVLTEQVHGDRERPGYLDDQVELIVGDVRDRSALERALAGVEAVVHLAARVGVGQSMYEIASYSSVNHHGTAVLLEAMMGKPIRKLLVASSMSIYGEGLYRSQAGELIEDAGRTWDQLRSGLWEPRGPDGESLEPLPTPESKRASLSSMYALGKFDQERMALLFGANYGVPTVALRFFNVYGPDQALSNPYTGVLAIFASRLLNGRQPQIFEDGGQRRDFTSVHDAARACALALARPEADGETLNVGSGRGVGVGEIAARLARVLGRSEIEPAIPGQYRAGDIRHCFADVSLARRTLNFETEVKLEHGMAELAGWLEGRAAQDNFEAATTELSARGLTVPTRP